ncbi:hypothetical protein [Alteromonas gracilis]|uniref:hypothetical protein n=1 Tax=Alteromonas gracilis TaxID=1479524 RepID=UPI0030D13A6E
MQRITKPFLALCACPCLLLSSVVNASAVEKAERWINQYTSSDNAFSMSLTKNKIQFKGCKQKRYQLALSQQIAPQLNIEAIVHYNKGFLDYGILSQRVRSHEFELVSWWDRGNYRVGLSHKVRPSHELRMAVIDTIQLPTSRTAGVYVEVPFNEDSHMLTIGALQESWEADGAALSSPWQSSRDNQVKVQYAISF